MRIKIISGGQTGADMGGLLAAKELKLKTGGFAPKNYITEEGSKRTLLKKFGLTELTTELYSVRTKANIVAADLTLVFMDVQSGGSVITIKMCKELGKKVMLNPDEDDLRKYLKKLILRKDVIINIAGNRESKSKGIEQRTKEFLVKVLKEFKQYENN